MAEINRKFDLEDRTSLFAERVRDFCMKLPKNPANNEYVAQLLRSSSSPGANYIEANEGIGGRDFIMKIKTCRREAKESAYWLRLIITDGSTATGGKGTGTDLYSHPEKKRRQITRSRYIDFFTRNKLYQNPKKPQRTQ